MAILFSLLTLTRTINKNPIRNTVFNEIGLQAAEISMLKDEAKRGLLAILLIF